MFLLFLSFLIHAQNHFDFNKSEANATLISEVHQLCDKIQNNASLIIEGHADIRGSESYNFKLSKKRAETVRDLIISTCNVTVKEIKLVPLGKLFPISRHHDLNRRVVIHVIQDKVLTYVIREKQIEEKKHYPNWFINAFVMNGYYDFKYTKTYTYAEAYLDRSWSAGVLISRKLFDSVYFSGGATLDSSYLLGVGFGF